MISASSAFASAVAASSRQFRAKIYYEGAEIEGDVRSLQVHLGSTGPDRFTIGSVFSSYAEVVLDGRNTTLEGKELEIKIGILTEENDYEYITLGHYTALAPAATKYRTTFTAVGRITSMLAVQDITLDTVTIQASADAITALTGVSVTFADGIDTTGVIDNAFVGNCRDALAVIAAAVGGYATETNEGGIIVSRFSSAVTASYGPDVMTELPEVADYDYEVTGIQALTPTGTFTAGSPVNFSIENNYITESLFNDFSSSLIGLSFRPGSARLALGDPRIEAGDVLQIAIDDETYVMPCMAVTHIFDGGLQTVVTVPAVEDVGKVNGALGAAVQNAVDTANAAASTADDARKVAINYISRDNMGLMIADMSDGTQYTPSTIPDGHLNTLISSDAYKVRDGQAVLATYGTEASIYTKDGTELAHFGYTEGQTASGHTYASPYYTFGSRRRGTTIGNWSFAAGVDAEASGYASVAAGHYATASGIASVAMGYDCEATGDDSTAFGDDTTASGRASTALGEGTTASGEVSIAAGVSATASGRAATAVGSGATASGFASVAAGYSATASGSASTATGASTTASGKYSTAIGDGASASGHASVASGTSTVAASENQTVRGTYNVEDADDTYADIIGNGTAFRRNNCFAVTWDGDIHFFLSTGMAAGTTDGDLYEAITGLGWESEVII